MNLFFCLVGLTTFLLFLFLSLSHGVEAGNNDNEEVTKIGAIINANSHIGKEEMLAMKIAVHNFNGNSRNHKLSLQFRDHQRNPLQAAMAAKELINEEKVKVIIGLETWEEAAIVAEVASRAQVPVLSFSSPAVTPPSMSLRWPYLIRMASNDSEQMKCIAAIVKYYNWRRVAAVYEDNALGGDSGKLDLLSEALQNVSSEIEYRLVLPPISLISDPNDIIQRELKKVQNKQSRVFILLQASLPMTTHLFREAESMGLLGEDSVWILTNTIGNSLDSLNTTTIASMEGTLGIKNYYSETGRSYQEFAAQFRRNFTNEYPEEVLFQPSIHALRAHDSIRIITQAMGRLHNNISSPKMLLRHMLSSNFSGLSGGIRFGVEGELLGADKLTIVNVVGKKYRELDFWSPNSGFSKTKGNKDAGGDDAAAEGLAGTVIWPGNLKKRNPKGWAMPTNQKKMRIGVPKITFFEKFVVKDDLGSSGKSNPNLQYDGFSVELFRMVVAYLKDYLNYDLPYDFVQHDGAYDDLISGVYNKTYDAAVGDLTILGNRTKYVEFTLPYTESGLSMIVPAKQEESTWIFLKPFTWELWTAAAATFIFTMFIVWFIENQSHNQDFSGTKKDQLSTILWFTSSTLFFCHNGKIQSNFTRVVVILWLSVVFILTSSYTASLSSLLTVRRLESNVTNIQFVKTNNLKVGCAGDTFVEKYLEEVLGIKKSNIVSFEDIEENYIKQFDKHTIDALFIERPYERLFLDKYCKKYSTVETYRFGGLGFAFPKGSPVAIDVSRAILELSENGRLKSLESKWFNPSPECSEDERYTITPENLTLHSFWGLYIVYGATSFFCFLLFVIRGKITACYKAATLLHNRRQGTNNPGRVIALDVAPRVASSSSSRWKYTLSPSHPPEDAQARPQGDVEMHQPTR